VVTASCSLVPLASVDGDQLFNLHHVCYGVNSGCLSFGVRSRAGIDATSAGASFVAS